jgi:hypothetical protein
MRKKRSETEKLCEINTGDLYLDECVRKDYGLAGKIYEFQEIIKRLLIREEIYLDEFEPSSQHAHDVEWILHDENEQSADKKSNPLFPYSGSFLDRVIGYNYEKDTDYPAKYVYHIYRYATDYTVRPDNKYLGKYHYDLLVAFKIRHTRHSDLIEFLDYQSRLYWSSEFQKKLYYTVLDHTDLIEESKLPIIKKWVEKSPKSIETMESKELRDSPELTIRESCMLFFVLLKGLDAWPDETNEITQSKVVDLIHAATGYSKDGIKKKINKDTFLEEDGQHEKSTSKVKRLLESLNSYNISDISSKQL